ncbi:MAG: DUF4421 family protein [Bacteroidetes bacterium]|nr:DUF4421 family protein [Bacteroidota bacterium]
MRVVFIIILSCATFILCAQLKSNENVVKKIKNWDTLKYQRFDYVVIVGYYQQYRNSDNSFSQLAIKDTFGRYNQKYVAESKLISGLVLNYDKFQVAFGFATSPQNLSKGKGQTKLFNIGFSFGDNRWVLETYYRKFTGFYNQNSITNDSIYKRKGEYYQLPGMTNTAFLARAMYFTNYKKFSYKAGYGCNYRQNKSAATWIMAVAVNYYSLNNDSAIFMRQTRNYYKEYGNFNSFSSFNTGFNGGFAATIVLYKAWYANFVGTIGPDLQFQNYNLGNAQKKITSLSFSSNLRFSIGLNLKRAYILTSIISDNSLFYNSVMQNSTSVITGNFSLGWRFNTGMPPKFYQKFQKTKIYNLF